MLCLNSLILGDAFLKSDVAESSNLPSGIVNVPKPPSLPAGKKEWAKAALVAGDAPVLALVISGRWPQGMLHEDVISRQK